MNLTTLAASCALACVLPVSFVAGSSGASTASHGATELTTIVIRYDPDVIFLTHDLVAPLCEREVVLKIDSSEEPVGWLGLQELSSNALQPKGVFVGQVRIGWASDAEVPEERHDEVLESGLYQLRKALGRRLTTPRHRALSDRAAALQHAIDELKISIERSSQVLFETEEAKEARATFEDARTRAEAADLERRSAQQELMVSMASMRKSEQVLVGARADLQLAEANWERQKVLVSGKVASELDEQKARQGITTARTRIDQAAADLEAERARVEQRSAQADLLETRYARFAEHSAAAKKRVEELPDAPSDLMRLQLELRIELDRSRLAEAAVELQRTMSARETLTDVTVERW